MGFKNPKDRLRPGRSGPDSGHGGGYAAAGGEGRVGKSGYFRILHDYMMIQECKAGRVRIKDSVRHAQAYGLARRIQRAAKLRTRHRA